MGNPDNIPVMREMGIDPLEVSRATNEMWLKILVLPVTLPCRLLAKLWKLIAH